MPPIPEKPAARSSRSSWRAKLAGASLAYLILAGTLGLAGGVGLFTFGYGKGAAYLSNNPETCINCHVMQDYYDSWQHSSHHHVAVCNDCHLSPHPVGKWVTKADNGFFHSLAFTLDNYHKPIRIKPRNRDVTQSACLHCHADMTQHMLPLQEAEAEDPFYCYRCHTDVGHALKR